VKCDIYSLGVTIYEALILSRPFVVPDYVGAAALAPFMAASRPRRASEISPGFPDELEEIIMKAMAAQPSRRFDTARELAAHLERYSLRSSFRFRRTPAKAPHWSRRVVTHKESNEIGRNHFSMRPPGHAPRAVKLATLPINDSELDQGL
jgi:serine/threonine protein kinase